MSARTDSRDKGGAGNPSSYISAANCSRGRPVVGGSPRAALFMRVYLTTGSGGRGGGGGYGVGGERFFFTDGGPTVGTIYKSRGSSCVRSCSNYLFSTQRPEIHPTIPLPRPQPRLRHRTAPVGRHNARIAARTQRAAQLARRASRTCLASSTAIPSRSERAPAECHRCVARRARLVELLVARIARRGRALSVSGGRSTSVSNFDIKYSHIFDEKAYSVAHAASPRGVAHGRGPRLAPGLH